MYSPADLPSRSLAAPARKRIWSIIGGISSDIVKATGLPVFSVSAATRSSARASSASAMRNSARLRSEGVASRHAGKADAAARNARSTSTASETGASANTSPVDGSISSAVRPSLLSTYSPSTKFLNRRTCVVDRSLTLAPACRCALLGRGLPLHRSRARDTRLASHGLPVILADNCDPYKRFRRSRIYLQGIRL